MALALSVSFVGSGNLAWHLAPALDNAGYVVREVYSRNPKNAKDSHHPLDLPRHGAPKGKDAAAQKKAELLDRMKAAAAARAAAAAKDKA